MRKLLPLLEKMGIIWLPQTNNESAKMEPFNVNETDKKSILSFVSKLQTLLAEGAALRESLSREGGELLDICLDACDEERCILSASLLTEECPA